MRCPECDYDIFDESLTDDYGTRYTCKKCGCKFEYGITVLKNGTEAIQEGSVWDDMTEEELKTVFDSDDISCLYGYSMNEEEAASDYPFLRIFDDRIASVIGKGNAYTWDVDAEKFSIELVKNKNRLTFDVTDRGMTLTDLIDIIGRISDSFFKGE